MTEHYAGPAAERIGELFWAMTILGAVVLVIFCLALAYGLGHRRSPTVPPTAEADRRGARVIVLLGAVVPGLILVPLFVWTVRTLAALDPRSDRPDLVVDLVGKQWWWEIRYRDADPGKTFVTANELHIPVGRRVELRLTSTDVIHSFWVPALQGKTDLIPGRENVTWIQADRPGVYGGQCAEYCGLQHATMGLLVVAQPPAEYEAWAAGQRRPAAEPGDSLARLGRAVFLGSACALCHAVRGTPAGGNAGPDLTHVAGRRTLAAALLPNSAGHLGGWIANPQALKPGSRMPRVPLSREEFRLVHRYLLSLE
ncbi:MAG TPA: cytochrome c oxidase subunit II [Gemmatimonadales bacterium]|nr:cytochrome c oxidase subunit II [Gemmatimonadales bacterium]